MHILPYKLVCSIIDPQLGEVDTPRLQAARGVIRLLLQDALKRLPFDENSYLRSNPDVASAIRHGDIDNAHTHYIFNGYFEAREGAGSDFAEAWYLKFYPDVALAVKSDQWRTGQHHYNEKGAFEWRSPNQAALPDVDHWRQLLTVFTKSPNLPTPH